MWVCFHCGAEFSDAEHDEAAQHFGARPDATPSCLADEATLRNLEADRDHWWNRALALEVKEESLDGLHADLRRRFGTTDPWLIADRLNNAEFRAEHATKLLDAAGIPFDAALARVEASDG
jgi:hypothetical protein